MWATYTRQTKRVIPIYPLPNFNFKGKMTMKNSYEQEQFAFSGKKWNRTKAMSLRTTDKKRQLLPVGTLEAVVCVTWVSGGTSSAPRYRGWPTWRGRSRWPPQWRCWGHRWPGVCPPPPVAGWETPVCSSPHQTAPATYRNKGSLIGWLI